MIHRARLITLKENTNLHVNIRRLEWMLQASTFVTVETLEKHWYFRRAFPMYPSRSWSSFYLNLIERLMAKCMTRSRVIYASMGCCGNLSWLAFACVLVSLSLLCLYFRYYFSIAKLNFPKHNLTWFNIFLGFLKYFSMRTVIFVAIVRIGYSCTNTVFVSRSQPHPNGWTAKFWIVNLPACKNSFCSWCI